MSPIPLKKKKRGAAAPDDPPSSDCLFPEVRVFFVERKMGSSRRRFLTSLAQRKGFCVMPEYSDAVTHVVSEGNSYSEVLEWIQKHASHPVASGDTRPGLHILDISWFTESMSCGRPVTVEPRHSLGVGQSLGSADKALPSPIPQYACQCKTPIVHHNKEITEALEILARAASFQSSEVRYLAFTRAASTLKSLPFKLRSVDDSKGLPWCGGHCNMVIQEILEDGVCREVEMVKSSERYQVMELLTGIFGVGVTTAERWYKEGVRNLSDLKSIERKLTKEQKVGLLNFTDLQTPVTREEAEHVERLVRDVFERFKPGVQVTMTGGFRRGKQQGHDVDFLITHPDEDALDGVLNKAVNWLERKGLLLYHHLKKRSPVKHSVSSTMDGHETCYTIWALPNSDPRSTDLTLKPCERADVDIMGSCSELPTTKDWKAVRVDLVVAPHSEYFYALLGWTGSKHFERELRRFSLQERKMSLNSHRLYDTVKMCSLPAGSEEEIFSHLGLQYVPPSDRNA
ncbi:DNA-directed DNA/RNA polymerase mu [Spea bombifrons]|uniref:DNA-directed DNA/RNA polymerase mu n=1 Tax=Spea bombifrons TaxID=233779 RepID=UPI00234BF337|nr:DNA-directed DNA/RNA polymerase mu [Spea bombifrons]